MFNFATQDGIPCFDLVFVTAANTATKIPQQVTKPVTNKSFVTTVNTAIKILQQVTNPVANKQFVPGHNSSLPRHEEQSYAYAYCGNQLHWLIVTQQFVPQKYYRTTTVYCIHVLFKFNLQFSNP